MSLDSEIGTTDGTEYTDNEEIMENGFVTFGMTMPSLPTL
jgi:hypothetical protein